LLRFPFCTAQTRMKVPQSGHRVSMGSEPQLRQVVQITLPSVEWLYSNIPAVGIPEHVMTSAELTTYGSQWKRIIAAFFGDMVEYYPRRHTVQTFSAQNISAFSHSFNIQPAGLPDAIGITHYEEVAWVFDNIDGAGYVTNPFNTTNKAAYVNIAALMSRMWVSFINDMDLNGHGHTGYPAWPKYDISEEGLGDNFVFDANVTPYVERDDCRTPGMAFMAAKAREQWKTLYSISPKTPQSRC